MSNRVKKILKNPAALFLTLAYRGVFNWMSDEIYLKIAFRAKLHKKLNLDNPVTFNEKLQWLKLHDRSDLYVTLVDKYEVKEYVANIIGEKYIIPTIGVYDTFDEIDFDSLPAQFVIKCTHDSGSIAICKNKLKFDYKKAKKIIDSGLSHNPFWAAREWPYKSVKPRVIVEKYLDNKQDKTDLRDYKFFCFNGKVKFFKIDLDRFTYHRANYYDLNGTLLPFGEQAYPIDLKRKVKFPNNLKLMVKLAEKLAVDTKFVRVDFYNLDEIIYFGEITFYPAGGFGIISPSEWDQKLGDWIII